MEMGFQSASSVDDINEELMSNLATRLKTKAASIQKKGLTDSGLKTLDILNKSKYPP